MTAIDVDKRLAFFRKYDLKMRNLVKKHYAFFAVYRKILTRVVNSYFSVYKKVHRLYEKISLYFLRVLFKISSNYKYFMLGNENAARLSTPIVNMPWMKYLLSKRYNRERQPIMQNGVHFITALQGGGKSTLAYDIIEEIRRKTGLGSYTTSAFEKPRYNVIEDKDFVYHQLFNLMDKFGTIFDEETGRYEATLIQNFSKLFRNVVLEEWFAAMNHRSNKEKNYNQIFLAIMNFLAQMRHVEFDRVYVISQIDTTDTQLMGLFKYTHEVQIDLDVPYWEWYRTGKLDKHILGWWITSYTYNPRKKKDSKNKVKVSSYYRKRTADFNYFNSKAQADIYKDRPVEHINVINKKRKEMNEWTNY